MKIQNFIWINRDDTNENPFTNVGTDSEVTKEQRKILDTFTNDFNKLIKMTENKLEKSK